MKLLSHKETKALVDDMTKVAPQAWDAWHDKHNRSAILYLPTGEIRNDAIVGFVWSWGMQDRIAQVPTSKQDKIGGLRAQGLEGLVQIETDLCVALMVYRDLPAYRAKIRV